MSSKSVSIQKLMLNSETHLGKLIAKARALQELNDSFDKLVGLELSKSCAVSQFEGGVLEIITSSASVATKLRFMEIHILQKLRTNPAWAGIRSVKVKTHPG